MAPPPLGRSPLSRSRSGLQLATVVNTLTQRYCSWMKNVTITLDDKTAAWARKHAAEKGMSLSRFIGEVLQKNMRRARDYERARRLFFSKIPVKLRGPGESYPSREELYDRGRLR